MQLVIVGIVAQFDVEIPQVVEQEDIVALIPISQNITGEIKRVELLLGGELGEIGGLHKWTGLTGEINKSGAIHQMNRPTLYTTLKTGVSYK